MLFNLKVQVWNKGIFIKILTCRLVICFTTNYTVFSVFTEIKSIETVQYFIVFSSCILSYRIELLIVIICFSITFILI